MTGFIVEARMTFDWCAKLLDLHKIMIMMEIYAGNGIRLLIGTMFREDC
jgi:hypothetical protein